MIVIDASALVAVALAEPDSSAFQEKMEQADAALMSPINLWEAIVRVRRVAGNAAVDTMEKMLADLGVEYPSIGASDARLATLAFARFGRNTPAGLNMGDCFAYALAKARGAPLLYKGGDFERTDVVSA